MSILNKDISKRRNRIPIPFLKRKSTITFIKFVFFAGTATIVDMSILFSLTEFLGLHYLVSGLLSYFAGMLTNYSLNKVNTFNNHSKKIVQQFGLFAIVALVGLGLNQIFLWVFTDVLGFWYLFSKVFTVFIVMFWSFFGHKNITFKYLK
jgi:putative flippase GtrA